MFNTAELILTAARGTLGADPPCFLCGLRIRTTDDLAYEVGGCLICVDCRPIYNWLRSPAGQTDVFDACDLVAAA